MKPRISSEDVLNAFTVEATLDRSTLERYLREFPQFAVELAHLSHELSRPAVQAVRLSSEDRDAINEAWKQYSTSTPLSLVNIFTALSVPQLRELAIRLGVPRQIITAFREHRVIVSSIPRRFLARLAEALNTSVEHVTTALTLPLDTICVRSHKADEKPADATPATFDQLLIEAQVPNDKRAELMAEEN
jgi:AmiR/NasT family two-component response regulator